MHISYLHITGYVASALIGLSLGLIGGGGSILTVPVLVYLFDLSPVIATSYSLFIVGSASLVGALNSMRKGLVNFRTAGLFGVSSVVTVFLTRKMILPAIPEQLFSIYGVQVTESLLTMILFAMLMILASVSMIRNGQKVEKKLPEIRNPRLPGLILYGVLIGLVTGLLGAGGGFILIPALIFFVGLSMKEAIGTSLLIIAINSLAGFTGDLGHFRMDFCLLAEITGIAMAGILVGGALSRKIDGDKLKKGFGWFVGSMGLYILVKEIFFK